MKTTKRMLKSTVSLILCLVLLLGTVLTSCDSNETKVPCDEISLSKKRITLTVGENTTLTAEIKPENATDKKITWSSSNEEVAFVVNGNVVAIGEGTAVIVATSSNGKTATCTVKVKTDEIVPTDISLSQNSLVLAIGSDASLSADVLPADASNKKVTWESSNSNVVTVSNGQVTAVGAGSAIVTASTHNGIKATCSVTVTQAVINPTSVSLNKTNITITEGTSATLTATVSPANAVNNVTWTSSNTAVAAVNNGKITAKGAGSATITVTTSNGKTATCTVTVNAAIQPTGVSLNITTLSLKEGNSSTLAATVSPSNATNKNVTWKSSNTKVATVSNGKVTAVGAGSATITVTTSNGKTATCTVTVEGIVKVTSVTLNKTALSLIIGNTETLSATVAPSNAENKSVTWKSSNTKVATVSNGKVTAVGAGSATITVASTNGKTATCTVTVTGNPLDDFYYTANTTGYTITGVKNKNKTSYVVPSNVTQIDDAVFSGCSNMESIMLPGNLEVKFGAIFGTLYDPKATATNQNGTTYYIPNSLKSVTLTASINSSAVKSYLSQDYFLFKSRNIRLRNTNKACHFLLSVFFFAV